jgi:hypothetical protein
VIDTAASAFKCLEVNRAVLEEIRQHSPNTKIIYRRHWDHDAQDIGNAEERREHTKATLRVLREHRGLIDYAEGWNEAVNFHSTPTSVLRQFHQDEMDFAKRLNDEGFGALIGGYSTGAWDFHDAHSRMYAAARSMLEYLNDTPELNGLNIHEYSGAYMAWGCPHDANVNNWDHQNHRPMPFDGGGIIWNPDIMGWWTLRYRMARQRFVQDGLSRIGMASTEYGLDDIQPKPGTGKGWRDWKEARWTNIMGNFAQQMKWYMWQVSHDPYIIGVVDFGFGTIDPTWDSFDLYQEPAMLDEMEFRMMEVPVGHLESGEPPAPGPEPEPPAPPNDDDVKPVVIVKQREGWYGVLRRMGQTPSPSSIGYVKNANPHLGEGLHTGDPVISPYHGVFRLSDPMPPEPEPEPEPPMPEPPAPEPYMHETDARLLYNLAGEFGEKFHDRRAEFEEFLGGKPPARIGGPLAAAAFVVHHSVSDMESTPPERIWNLHIKIMKWDATGYGWWVGPDGEVHLWILPSSITYGVQDRHAVTYNGVLPGRFHKHHVTRPMVDALYRVLCCLDDAFVYTGGGEGGRVWRGHSEWAMRDHPTACPGQYLMPHIRTMRGPGYGAADPRPRNYP